jgi:4-amino-4-deoxy-L-arabinose transferase-like glycosyltransferase
MKDRTLWALLGIAAVLRIPALGSGLWYDEIWTLVDFGRLDLGALLTSYGSDNNHPFYTLLAWLAMRGLGESAFALRLPAMVFGVASVGAMFLLSRRVATRTEALAATMLLAISYHHVWFSQNARGYTALLFFTLVSTHLLLRIVEGAEPKTRVLYGLVIGLGAYTHMTQIFAAMAHAAVLLVLLIRRHPRAKDLFLGLTVAGGVTAALHAPIFAEMAQFLFEKKAKTHVESEWTSPWWTVRAVALSFGAGLVPGLAALAGAAAVLIAGVANYARKDLKIVILFLGPAAIGGAVMIGLGRNLWPRFFFFVAGFLLLILVRGVLSLAHLMSRALPLDLREPGERALAGAGAVALIAGSMLILPRAYGPKQDFEGAKAFVDQVRQPGQAVMTAGLTDLPYQRWLRSDYVAVDSVEALDRALDGRSGYLLHTLPTFVESRMPDLAEAIATRGREVKRFPGSVGGGDVVVLQFPKP